jgi:GH43 family beta-xylosidase
METIFLNPVYPHNFPDPFVLKYRGEYWAYGTGPWRDGRWFGVLRSRDLAAWEEVGGAMEPLPGHWPCLWAPEVSYHNGRFYLYYSIGDEATMQIRVATSAHPAGPFVDSGRRLTSEPFAIDAHVFVDEDGARHMFYATDYLEHSHVGTGTARVRLADPLTPVGASTPVTRARYDWQVYDPQRAEKGGVRWHTIEGSFVLKRKGRYFQMFSGGNWQHPSYGVSYAVAERIDTAEEWAQAADGERVLPILRTVPGLVVGPGHNSAVRGPSNTELFCVYHRWADDMSGRVMAVDRLDWAGERMLLLGPSTTPQPVLPPTFADFFDDPRASGLGAGWACAGGSWAAGGGEAIQRAPEPATASCAHRASHFVAEVSARALDAEAGGGYGVTIGDDLRFLIQPGRGRALALVRRDGAWAEQSIPLPADFAPEAYHLLRVEVNGARATVALDEATARWEGSLPSAGPRALALHTDGAAAAFAGFALTEGWADLFYPGEAGPAAWGWGGGAGWQVAGGELIAPEEGAPLLKGPLPAAFELMLNVRLLDADGLIGFGLAGPGGAYRPRLELTHAGGGWALLGGDGPGRPARSRPPGLNPLGHQQLRATVRGGELRLSWEGRRLGVYPAPPGATAVALWGWRAAVELARVTALPPGDS